MWVLGEEGFESEIFSLLPIRAEFYWVAFFGAEVPVWFLLYASTFALFSALKITLSVRRTIEIWCSKMALQQDDNISLGMGGSKESRGELSPCWFLPVLRNLLLSLSDDSPIIFSMSWENNQIRRTRKRHVFLWENSVQCFTMSGLFTFKQYLEMLYSPSL